MSLMGVGTNILGYGCEEVDTEVQNIIKKKYVSLNCPEEVYLAEKLIAISLGRHGRFARTGGEANSCSKNSTYSWW